MAVRRYRQVLFSIVITFALSVTSAKAATYYVATTGNDANSCNAAQNQSTPKKTIAAGVACMSTSGGDTVYLRGGTYAQWADRIDSQEVGFVVPSGASWSSANTVAGYTGEVAIIQPANGGWSAIKLTTNAPHHLIFQDLVIDMGHGNNQSDNSGVYLSSGAHHNRFVRVEVKNAWHNGVSFSRANANSPFNEFIDSKIHDNGRDPAVNAGYGAYISTSDNLFQGNEVYANGGYGLHFYDNAGPKYVARNVIRGNKIYGNGTRGGWNCGVVVAWGDDNRLENNLIYGNRCGFYVGNAAGNAQVINNTVYGNQPLEAGVLQYYASAPVLRNNIAFNNGAPITNYGGTGTPVMTNNLLGVDPIFENVAANDFRLKTGSPAIDAGMAISGLLTDIAGIVRPQGASYDIGAHERLVSAPPPPPPAEWQIVNGEWRLAIGNGYLVVVLFPDGEVSVRFVAQ